MDNLPLASEAIASLTDANKIPRAAHLEIVVDTINTAIFQGLRKCEFRSWCLQDADLDPIRAKEYNVTLKGDLIQISW